MAREVIFKTWCDPCLEEKGEHVEGEEIPALHLPELPGRVPMTLALCEVHRKEIYDPLVQMLRDYGQHVDAEGNPSGPKGKYRKKPTREQDVEGGVSCPAEGCDHVSPNRQAIASHARSVHDATLGELEGKPLPFTCPECEQSFTRAQGMAAHRSRKHGVAGANVKIGKVAAAKKAQRAAARASVDEPLAV